MTHPLLYLFTRSLAGSLRQRVRRLRQPKYLFGALFGALYFYFYFYRFLFAQRHGIQSFTGPSPLGENIGALLLFIAVLFLAWIFPGQRTALTFSEAEIVGLFPAPLTRRALIRYKLLTSQFGIFFFAAFMTLVTGRAATGSGWLHLAGWWVIIATFSFHRLGASFALTRLMDRGMANWQRRVALVVGVSALAGALWLWREHAPAPPTLNPSAHGHEFIGYFQDVLTSGPAPWLLWPFRIMVRPYFAADAHSFLQALWPALCILVLHYWWVVRADVSFEEASIALAQRRANLVAARQKGNLRIAFAPRRAKDPAFALRPTGFVSTAFVWKALLYSGGRGSLRILLIVIGGLIAAAAALSLLHPTESAAFTFCLLGCAVFCIVLFAGISSGATYLRQDLPAMDLLQTFPVRGWQIVLGQLFTQAALGTLMQWGALALIAISAFDLNEAIREHIGEIHATLGGLAILALPLNLATMIVPAGALLLWPGWFKGGTGVGVVAFEAAGLRIILLLGQLLAILVALLLPALAAVGIWSIATYYEWGSFWLPVAATAAASILAAEAWIGILALGAIFEGYDVSSE